MKTFADQCVINAPLADVAAAIMSVEYLEYRYKTEAVDRFDLEVKERAGSLFAYRLRRVISLSGKVPRVARSLVGDSLIVIQTADWQKTDDGFEGRFNLSEERFSGGIDVVVSLSSSNADQCDLSFEGELKVNVPLIGKQIEKLMADRVAENFTESITAIEGYLSQKNG